jgi:hypothetical protein
MGLNCGLCKQYQALAEQLDVEREAFRRDAAERGLPRRDQYRYPDALLHDLPDFVDWLPQYTSLLVNANGSSGVDIELLRLTGLPSRQAETYQQMWPYGNHYRVVNEGEELGFVTQDYGIASIFGAEEGRSAGVSMVGILKEIIVVRYSAQRRVVFRGSWATGFNQGGPIWLHRGAFQRSYCKEQGTLCITRHSPTGKPPYLLQCNKN